VRATAPEVFSRGTDVHLNGTGDDRWWMVGPRTDLIGARVADLTLGPVSTDRHRLDEPDAYERFDLSSGEAPLLVAGRIERDGDPRPGARPVAVLVGDVVAAVVPTYDDGSGPGRFAAMLAPELLAGPDTAVRVADVTGRGSETVLRLIPES
jgi:hypothetical protein